MTLATQLNHFYILIDECDRKINHDIKNQAGRGIKRCGFLRHKRSTRKRPRSAERATNYTMLGLYSLSLIVIGHPPAVPKNRNRGVYYGECIMVNVSFTLPFVSSAQRTLQCASGGADNANDLLSVSSYK